MNTEQERADFEAWWPSVGQTIGKVAAWEAWKAGRAALQHSCKETSQDREDAYDIEAAAKTLAECMDYPWEPMPEKGREAMRKFAKRVIDHARRIEGDGE